ncbi:MAG: sulfoxide reductase heme-binding subunit YedZ [Rhodospirillaceae bacterium]|jgi:methionine sulfoxide reductase heme-binding subunit|nr:sulfoxide reductase heme-binding subunit YedZ [Rhodospirillaceae bacterium]
MTPDQRLRWIAKPAVWLLALGPLAWLAWRVFNQDLTANPAEFMNRYLGEWALRMLFVALAVTPLRRLTGQVEVMRFRRLVGLFAFFYVALHVSSYVVVDQFFDWPAIWADIVKRLYISLGMGALVILAAMTATSTAGMIKRLGRRKWSRLHKGVYGAAVLAVIHFFMMRKGFQIEPLVYAGILAMLLGARLLPKRRSKRPARNQASST